MAAVDPALLDAGEDTEQLAAIDAREGRLLGSTLVVSHIEAVSAGAVEVSR